MPKPLVNEARFDFRGGLNTAISPDLLNPNELVDATNIRLSASYGAITKRSGNQRIHQTAFTDPIVGVTQWDGPSGKQIVVITNGTDLNLWYRNGFNYATGFTGPTTLASGVPGTPPAFFMPFRDATSGAPLHLFIAIYNTYVNWSGTASVAVSGPQAQADRVVAYHTRGFTRDRRFAKTLYWSKVGDATTAATGTKTDGGSALVDVLSGEEIIALEVIGSSLLIATEDCLMRFTGHATDDIVIAQDTEGVSSEVGAVGPRGLCRFENVCAVFNERGPYAATEVQVVPIGEQVGPDFAGMNTTFQSTACVGYNRGRKELIFAFCPDDSGQNKTLMVQSIRLQAWYRWEFPVGVITFSRYERSDGSESLLGAFNDKFVRDLDVGELDDIRYDGSGGANITMIAELPPLQFGAPGKTKVPYRMALQANVPSGSNLQIGIAADDEPFSYTAVQPTTGEDSQRIDFDEQGKRIYLQFKDDSSKIVGINGFDLEAYLYGRP